MADEQEIEQDEVDTTAEKAKAIGKEIGVVEDKLPEKLDDYEIQEEDEKIAKEREPKAELKDSKKMTNREKRHARMNRIKQKLDTKDETIRQQQERIAQLENWKQQVDGRLTGIDRNAVEQAINETSAAYSQAERDHAAAFAEGDGVKATKAMKDMYAAQRHVEKLQGIKKQFETMPQQQVAQPNQNQPDNSALVNKAKAWAERNTWYDPSGKDVDSEIAKAISGVLANEGYDPTTDDFWDELDERVAERLPEKFRAMNEDDEDEEIESAPKVAVKRRTGPPINGNVNRSDLSNKKKITVPTAYLEKLKANGITDPARIKKIALDRARILRESGQ
jgi:hypothetical protein